MTTKERLCQLEELRKEYYSDRTSIERRVEILTQVQIWAAEETDYHCQHCGEAVIAIEDVRPYIPGHIYSEDGRREYATTKMCEYCFDEVLLPPDDERRKEWFPDTYKEVET